MTNQAELDEFYNFLLRQDLRKPTIINNVKRAKFMHKYVYPLTPQNFERYIYKLKDEGKSNSYLNSLIICARKWEEFKNIKLCDLKTFRPKKTHKVTFSDEEIERFLALKPTTKVNPARFYEITLFFEALAYTGCRPAELERLEVSDIDFGRNIILFRDTKTHDNREIPIPPNIYDKLYQHTQNLKGHVFKINTYVWNYQFNFRLKRADIQKRKGLTTYSFRHTYATRLIEGDLSVFKVKRLLGHKNIATTEIYVHLATKDLQQAIMKHPVIAQKASPTAQIDLIYDIIKNLDLDKRFNTKIEKSKSGLKLEVQVVS